MIGCGLFSESHLQAFRAVWTAKLPPSSMRMPLAPKPLPRNSGYRRSAGLSTKFARSLWTLLPLPLFLCNAGYALFVLKRNRTATLFRLPRSSSGGLLTLLMGVMWMAGNVRVVLVANLPGILTGEWRGAPSAVSRKVAMGVSLLVLAIAGLARANSLQGRLSALFRNRPRVRPFTMGHRFEGRQVEIKGNHHGKRKGR